MFTVYLGIGTNIGNKKGNLDQSLEFLKQKGCKISVISSIYETEPWGGVEQENYYNIVAKIQSPFYPFELLKITQAIELKMGRIKLEKWGARIIDLDILFFENYHFSTSELIVPHRFIQNRNFVLNPLEEINPDFVHPVSKKNIRFLKENCQDTSWINKL